ncbi:MAG: hypothetical protein PHS45_02780 [Bacilli bacterium]|nr:hypothetical protein [Bacilli bacterium]
MKNENKVISFPHLGNYHIPIRYLLANLLEIKVMEPLPITKKTLEIGSRHSPDFVCVPFKYNLGNFIESLDRGANILIQAVGGCRFGYYAELQKQILSDLGYNFDFIDIIPKGKMGPLSIYKEVKKHNPNISLIKCLYIFYVGLKMTWSIEKTEKYIRSHAPFEIKEKSFEYLFKAYLKDLKVATGLKDLNKIIRKYKRLFKKVKINKTNNHLRVGIIGELYTSMEPFSTNYIEKRLIEQKIEVTRLTTATYLLFRKSRFLKQFGLFRGKYLKYHIGADGTESIIWAKRFAELGYDGLIHTKPFACTPEVDAMHILPRVSRDYKIPILYLSFDSQSSEEGMLTRLEAFCDMLRMKRREKDEKGLFRG